MSTSVMEQRVRVRVRVRVTLTLTLLTLTLQSDRPFPTTHIHNLIFIVMATKRCSLSTVIRVSVPHKSFRLQLC